jgi:amino acid transporter
VSVLFCALIWALALKFSFERLISIDLVLYGGSLMLEYVALVVLRRREPELVRPFRVPGGTAGAVAVGVGPALLIGYAIYSARGESVAGLNALLFAALIAVAGAVVYGAIRLLRRGA